MSAVNGAGQGSESSVVYEPCKTQLHSLAWHIILFDTV